MADIARLDQNGVLIAVETVSASDWLTNPAARTVQLPDNHDMRERLRAYRFDFMAERFEPINILGRSGEHAMELGDALIETVSLIADHVGISLPQRLKRALGK